MTETLHYIDTFTDLLRQAIYLISQMKHNEYVLALKQWQIADSIVQSLASQFGILDTAFMEGNDIGEDDNDSIDSAKIREQMDLMVDDIPEPECDKNSSWTIFNDTFLMFSDEELETIFRKAFIRSKTKNSTDGVLEERNNNAILEPSKNENHNIFDSKSPKKTFQPNSQVNTSAIYNSNGANSTSDNSISFDSNNSSPRSSIESFSTSEDQSLVCSDRYYSEKQYSSKQCSQIYNSFRSNSQEKIEQSSNQSLQNSKLCELLEKSSNLNDLQTKQDLSSINRTIALQNEPTHNNLGNNNLKIEIVMELDKGLTKAITDSKYKIKINHDQFQNIDQNDYPNLQPHVENSNTVYIESVKATESISSNFIEFEDKTVKKTDVSSTWVACDNKSKLNVTATLNQKDSTNENKSSNTNDYIVIKTNQKNETLLMTKEKMQQQRIISDLRTKKPFFNESGEPKLFFMNSNTNNDECKLAESSFLSQKTAPEHKKLSTYSNRNKIDANKNKFKTTDNVKEKQAKESLEEIPKASSVENKSLLSQTLKQKNKFLDPTNKREQQKSFSEKIIQSRVVEQKTNKNFIINKTIVSSKQTKISNMNTTIGKTSDLMNNTKDIVMVPGGKTDIKGAIVAEDCDNGTNVIKGDASNFLVLNNNALGENQNVKYLILNNNNLFKTLNLDVNKQNQSISRMGTVQLDKDSYGMQQPNFLLINNDKTANFLILNKDSVKQGNNLMLSNNNALDPCGTQYFILNDSLGNLELKESKETLLQGKQPEITQQFGLQNKSKDISSQFLVNNLHSSETKIENNTNPIDELASQKTSQDVSNSFQIPLDTPVSESNKISEVLLTQTSEIPNCNDLVIIKNDESEEKTSTSDKDLVQNKENILIIEESGLQMKFDDGIYANEKLNPELKLNEKPDELTQMYFINDIDSSMTLSNGYCLETEIKEAQNESGQSSDGFETLQFDSKKGLKNENCDPIMVQDELKTPNQPNDSKLTSLLHNTKSSGYKHTTTYFKSSLPLDETLTLKSKEYKKPSSIINKSKKLTSVKENYSFYKSLKNKLDKPKHVSHNQILNKTPSNYSNKHAPIVKKRQPVEPIETILTNDPVENASKILALCLQKETEVEKPLTCKICSMVFCDETVLNKHVEEHNLLGKFTCTVCKKVFNNIKTLKVHSRVHTGEKPFRCSVCGKTFSQRGVLSSHLAVHAGVKPYVCKQCGRAFTQKSQLRLHEMRHGNIRHFACNVCPFKFTTKSDLQRHQRSHEGVKPFECEYCDKTFTRQIILKEHMNRHTGAQPYTCSNCKKCFFDGYSLNKHMKLCTKIVDGRLAIGNRLLGRK